MSLIRIVSVCLCIIILSTMPAMSTDDGQDAIIRNDIAAGILDALATTTLTTEALTDYFETHRTLLQSNIEQGLARYEKDTIDDLVAMNFDRYLEDRNRILVNYKAFNAAQKHIIETVSASFSTALPSIVLIPCLGTYANGGWAATIDGTQYVFVALEMIHPPVDIGVLLMHEIGHTVSDVGWDILLDGIYNEGYATWVSYELVPGKPLGTYLMKEPAPLADCYRWMEEHRQTIAGDIDEPLEIMNDMHRFYLTSSYSEYPNIGYVIGFEYIRYLRLTHSLEELRTFSRDSSANRAAFDEFIRDATFGENIPQHE